MSAQNPKYSVYGNEYVLTMNGDRVETEAVHSEDDWILESDNLDECRAAANRWVAEQGPATVTHAESGIGSITYSEADIHINRYEDGEVVPVFKVGVSNNLTDELMGRFDKAKRSYYDWLDYESDEYDEI